MTRDRFESLTRQCFDVVEGALEDADEHVKLGALRAWLGYLARTHAERAKASPPVPAPRVTASEAEAANERLRNVPRVNR